jgi:hypothetical protein
MPSNVNFVIKVAQIEYLNVAMNKVTKIEEIAVETYANPYIIISKVQKQMDTFNIVDQGASTSRKVEDQRARNTRDQGLGGGIRKGVIPNVTNDPATMQETKQRMEIAQKNQTIRQMENKLTRL